MFGLTALGVLHTLVGATALALAFTSLIRYRQISLTNRLGLFYAGTTALTALTALAIFQHGGFGPGHGLAVLTLVALTLAVLAAGTRLFGAASRFVEPVSLLATVLFHLVPAVTEAATRLPPGHPLAASPEAQPLKAASAALALVFVIGAVWQVIRLRSKGA